MIATTISNSINEKPFCLFRILFAPFNQPEDFVLPRILSLTRDRPEYMQPPCQLRTGSWQAAHMPLCLSKAVC
jgi:hypothetical protein